MFPPSCLFTQGKRGSWGSTTQRLLLLPKAQGWRWMGTSHGQTYSRRRAGRREEDRLYSLLGLLLSTFTSVLALTELLLL